MTKFRLMSISRIIIFVILTFLLVLTLTKDKTYDSVFAENSDLPSISIEDKTVHRGQTFEVEVNLDSNPGLASLMLYLEYDKSVMTFVGFRKGDALGDLTFTSTNLEAKDQEDPFRFLWDGSGAKDLSTGNLLVLEFSSKLSAPIGKYLIKLDYDRKSTTIGYLQPIDLLIDNGEVELTAGEFKVQYLNYDGTLLQERDFNDGEIPTYTGTTPTRPTDEKYSYTFRGWKAVVSDQKNTIVYIAQYSTTPQEYQVWFYVDGEYFAGDIYGYNEYIDLSIAPSKKNHNFSGWHLDEEFTQKVDLLKMPANDLILYGYMKYNIREENIPKIVLSLKEIVDNVAYVDVNITENSGLSGFVLTLNHSKDALKFIGFERGEEFEEHFELSTTNLENGYDVDLFKFYFTNGTTNVYNTGKLMTLKFEIREGVPAGIYDAILTYNEKTDAEFILDGENWYTKLNIVGAKIPVGQLYNWQEETDDGIIINVTTEQGQPPETVLYIKRITHKINLSQEQIIAVAGEGMELKDVYSISLMRNGVEIQPECKITVKIQLTKNQLKSKQLTLFNLDQNNRMVEYQSDIQDEKIVFETQTLVNNWAIVGEITPHESSASPSNASILIISLSLLIIAILGLLLILKARLKKKK